jgi:hypothetical protein
LIEEPFVSPPNKSFFSSLAGLITGIAGLLTATVAIFGVASSQGWLSGAGSKSPASAGAPAQTTTPSAGSTTTSPIGGAGGPGGVASVPQYAVDPTSVTFPAVGTSTTMVKVSNTGVVPLTVQPPEVTGPGASHFNASAGTCDGSVDPGRSCQIQMTFNRVPGTFNATLVVQVMGAVQATEVPVSATAIL